MSIGAAAILLVTARLLSGAEVRCYIAWIFLSHISTKETLFSRDNNGLMILYGSMKLQVSLKNISEFSVSLLILNETFIEIEILMFIQKSTFAEMCFVSVL